MIKVFLKDSLIYTIPAFISRGIAIFLLPLYTQITTPEGLGVLDLFLVFGNIISLTVALEISQGVARFIPEKNSNQYKLSIASTGFCFLIITYLIFLLFAIIFSEEVNFFITGDKKYLTEFKLAVFFIFFNGFFYYFQNLLRFNGRSKQFSIISIIYAFLNLAFTFLFGMILDYKLQGIFYSLIVSTLLSSFLGYFFLRDYIHISINFSYLKKLLSFSIPLVPSSILVFFSLYVDRYMLKEFIGIEEVGFYSVGVRISAAAGLVMIGFQMSISPLIYKYHSNKQTPTNLSYIFKIFVCLALIFFTIFSLLSKELILLLTSPLYYEVTSIIPILALTFLFSNIYVFMPGMVIKKKTNIILCINMFIAIANIIFNMMLIPMLGILGASIATFLGYFLGFLMYVYFSQKLYYVNHLWFTYSFNFAFSILLVYCYQVYLINENALISILARLCFIMCLLFLFFYSKLITKEDFKTIKAFLYSKIGN